MPKTWCCPFFRWEDRLRVNCEGGRVCFHDGEERRLYINRFCACVPGWEGCSIAQGLQQYYERLEEHEKKHGSGTTPGKDK